MALKRKAEDCSTNDYKKAKLSYSPLSENGIKNQMKKSISSKKSIAEARVVTCKGDAKDKNKEVIDKGKTPVKQSSGFVSNWKNLIQAGVIKYKPKPGQGQKQSTNAKQQCKAGEAAADSPESKIWFEDVDDILIEPSHRPPAPPTPGEEGGGGSSAKPNPLVKPDSFEGLTRAVAMDCEMVGVGYGGKDSILARVSVVNQYGRCVYDRYCRPTERVTDFRTHVSGIRPKDIANGEEFKIIQKEVSDIIEGRILVGHAIQNDLKVLFLAHPKKQIRDTARYAPFRALSGGATPSLKKLAGAVLGVEVQGGEHDSVQDAQAAMRLYTLHRAKWEAALKQRGARETAKRTKMHARKGKKKGT